MNLDNILRTMNEYINDIFSAFGGQSVEYSTALKQVRENIPKAVLDRVTTKGLNYKGDNPTEPLQFSRSKAAKEVLQVYETDIQQLRAQQRETGTAKVQSQRYYTEQKIEDEEKPVSQKRVKEQAAGRYDFNTNVNDWYDKIMASPYLSDEEKEAFRDKYSTLHVNYSDAAVRDDIQAEAERLMNIIKQREAAGDIRQKDAEQYANIQGVGTSLDNIT